MKKIFTFAAALLASVSLWATSVSELSFNEPTALPEGYVYSSTNTPVIANAGNKSAVYVTNGGGGSVTAACFSEDGLVAGQGKRWMGFIADEESSVVISVYSSQKVWTLYKSDGTAFATYTNAAKNTWEDWTIETLPAGQDILTAGSSQCYVSAITFTGGTPSTDPVESAEISGENACALSGSVELTCNAPKATTYQWSMNGAEIEGATAKKYTFTPSAAGEFSFTCAASNEYTETPVVAAAFVVTVTDPAAACGELIKAVLGGGTSATMSGVLGGTFDTNLGSGKYKLDKGKYIGIQLAAGSFMAGDVVTIVMTTAGSNYPCLFADKDRTNCLFLATEVSEATEYQITLPAAATGLTALYLSRGDDTDEYKWNPVVASISVTRSCEASNNANIASMTINGEAVAEAEGVFNYTVAASAELAQVEVVYTLAHPLATATPASGFTINVPAAGADANTQVITVTAQDGTTVKQYTVSVSKSDAASTEAHLSALSVMGYTLAPVFEEGVFNYTLTKAYGAEDPSLSAVVADPKDVNAQANVAATENGFSITVTAEDGTTQLVYTITVVQAAARKDLLMVRFSNNVHGYIANGIINVPYLAGTEEPVFESASFWEADGEPTAEMVEGNLVVTGIDGQSATYTINYEPVNPMEPNYEEITFDGTEIGQFIYSVYGWDADKGIKFSKDLEEASNHRISEGKDRIFMAFPAALSVTLTSGTGASRSVKVYVNGSLTGITKTAAKNESIQIPLDGSKNNYVVIESENNNGDAGFIKMQLEQSWATGIDNTDAAVKAVKVVRNGQLFIEKNGVLYNAQGAVVK